jgi:hypothetical protein
MKNSEGHQHIWLVALTISMPDNLGMPSQYTLITKNLFPQYTSLAISVTNPVPRNEWADWVGDTLVFDDILFIGLREGADIAEDVECQIYVNQKLLTGPDANFDDSGLQLVLDEKLHLPDNTICFWMDDDTLAHSLRLDSNEVSVKGYYTVDPNKLVVVLEA